MVVTWHRDTNYELDNDSTNTLTTINETTAVPIRLRTDNNRADMQTIYRPTNCACTPTINRPTDRQVLYLTTITTAAGTVLPPKQAFAACDLPIN